MSGSGNNPTHPSYHDSTVVSTDREAQGPNAGLTVTYCSVLVKGNYLLTLPPLLLAQSQVTTTGPEVWTPDTDPALISQNKDTDRTSVETLKGKATKFCHGGINVFTVHCMFFSKFAETSDSILMFKICFRRSTKKADNSVATCVQQKLRQVAL